jgi:hypothetical protein
MVGEPVFILDSGGEPVEAVLYEGLSSDDLREAEVIWAPIRKSAAKRLVSEGADPPDHFHWDWSRKAAKLDLTGYDVFGIQCAGHWQGLMMTDAAGHVARLAPDVGRSTIYVEYLEAAPWNVKPLVMRPRFKGIGKSLLRAAVLRSMRQGNDGRVSLHSLEAAEAFYHGKCGMTELGRDADVENLTYFEFTAVAANAFARPEL